MRALAVLIVLEGIRAGERMLYLYDFGDDWSYDIALEKTVTCYP
jgi:hypothetical protein